MAAKQLVFSEEARRRLDHTHDTVAHGQQIARQQPFVPFSGRLVHYVRFRPFRTETESRQDVRSEVDRENQDNR